MQCGPVLVAQPYNPTTNFVSQAWSGNSRFVNQPVHAQHHMNPAAAVFRSMESQRTLNRTPVLQRRARPREPVCNYCGRSEMFGTIGCYDCYLTRTVLISKRGGRVQARPVAPGDRDRRQRREGEVKTCPEGRSHALARNTAGVRRRLTPRGPITTSPDASVGMIAQRGVYVSPPPEQPQIRSQPDTYRRKVSPSPDGRTFIAPPMDQMVRATIGLGDRVCVSERNNKTGVVIKTIDHTRPAKLAVQMDNGRVELFDNSYLLKINMRRKDKPLNPPRVRHAPLQQTTRQNTMTNAPMTYQSLVNDIVLVKVHDSASDEEENEVPPAPLGWMVLAPGHPQYDPQERGKIYYYNKTTGHVQYERPGKQLRGENRDTFDVRRSTVAFNDPIVQIDSSPQASSTSSDDTGSDEQESGPDTPMGQTMAKPSQQAPKTPPLG